MVAALERRVEQLTLRCMDQDQVISTLFAELSAVGQELERREQAQLHLLNKSGGGGSDGGVVSAPRAQYVTPEQAAMILAQSIEPPLHVDALRGVASEWPHFPLNSPEQSRSVTQQRLPPQQLIQLGQFAALEDGARAQMLRAEHEEAAALAEIFALDLAHLSQARLQAHLQRPIQPSVPRTGNNQNLHHQQQQQQYVSPSPIAPSASAANRSLQFY
jgi:hypothetical protein